MKYLSPLKFSLEIALRKEFHDSLIAQWVLDSFGYDMGIEFCRTLVIVYFVSGRIIALIAFVAQTARFA